MSPDSRGAAEVEAVLSAARSLREQKHFAEAIAMLRQEGRAASSAVKLELAKCLADVKAFDEARQTLCDLVAADPHCAAAFYQLGIVQRQLGAKQEALSSFQRTIAIEPDYPNTWYRCGNIYAELEDFDAAVDSYERAIRLHGEVAEYLFNLGVVLRKSGRLEAAMVSYQRAIAVNPRYADAYFNLGNLLAEQQRTAEALAAYRMAVDLKPAFMWRAVIDQGLDFVLAEMWEQAEEAFQIALAADPSSPEVLARVADGYREMRQFDKALAYVERALLSVPDDVSFLLSKAAIYRQLGDPRIALEILQHAQRIAPTHAEAWTAAGAVLGDLARFAEARHAYDQAIACDPKQHTALFNKSLLLLTLGEFEEGFRLYEWRHDERAHKRHKREFSAPSWRGEPLADGAVLLLTPEQGLGDFIHFSRYALESKFGNAEIVLEAPEVLLPLFEDWPAPITLLPTGHYRGHYDAQLSIMSLPRVFETGADSVPAKVPYVSVPARYRQRWQARLGALSAPRVGVVWSGSTTHKGDHRRSLRLGLLLELFRGELEWHSLQKEYRAHDLQTLDECQALHRHEHELNDFGDTAALVESMDLIITVDTSVAHLAGALGKEVWILLPISPDWRWLLAREDSPWYPSARLFRQPSLGDWDSVLAEVKAALLARFPGCA